MSAMQSAHTRQGPPTANCRHQQHSSGLSSFHLPATCCHYPQVGVMTGGDCGGGGTAKEPSNSFKVPRWGSHRKLRLWSLAPRCHGNPTHPSLVTSLGDSVSPALFFHFHAPHLRAPVPCLVAFHFAPPHPRTSEPSPAVQSHLWGPAHCLPCARSQRKKYLFSSSLSVLIHKLNQRISVQLPFS